MKSNFFTSFAFSLSIVTVFSASASGRPPTPAHPAVVPHKLGSDFVEHCGQWDARTKFALQEPRSMVLFEPDAVELRARNSKGAARIIRLSFEGAEQDVSIGGENRQAFYNFYFGNDPDQWHSQVSAFKSIMYRKLYPGLDVRMRKDQGRLEYDLLLNPRAELDRIIIRCEGGAVEIASDGALILQTPDGFLRQTPPKTWEELPDGSKRTVDCRFRKIDENRYGFTGPNWDRTLPLVIDPGLEWSTFIGGSFSDELTTVALARDGTGDIFVAGYMNSRDFPFFNDPNFTPEQNRVFVARMDGTGTSLRWATFLGGWHSAVLYRALAAAPDGGVAIAGQTVSPDFPTTPGAY